MVENRLQELHTEYTSTYPRSNQIKAEFCDAAEEFFKSEGIDSEKYQTQIRRLHEKCGQKVDSELVAEAVGCSVQYARRFSYDGQRGAYEKGWSKSTQNEKVSPGTRTRIISRDGRVCLRCETEEELEVHHITPVSQGGQNKDSNLATLCSDCHQAAHGGSKTSGRTAYDEEEFEEWLGRDAPDQENSSIMNTQKRLSDY
jgi:hypothetical protein